MGKCRYYVRLRGRSRCDHPRKQGAKGCLCIRPIRCPYLVLDRAEAALKAANDLPLPAHVGPRWEAALALIGTALKDLGAEVDCE